MNEDRHVFSRATVVDADVHLTVHPDDLAPYLDDPYNQYVSSEVNEDDPFPSNTWPSLMGGKIEDRWSTFTEVEDIRSFQRKFGIDHPIVNTNEPLGKFPQSGLATNLMRGYNDLLLDKVLDRTDDIYGLALIAPQNPSKAAEEIDRLASESGIRGVYIGTSGTQPPLGDTKYDPIYEAAEDHGLPIVFHGNAGDFMIEFPRQNQALNKYIQVHTLAHHWDQELTMTSLIFEGVPEKFPDLDFVFLEAGIGWVPYLMYRMNREYAIRRSEAPLLRKSPEEYVRESCYFGTQPIGEPNDPAHMQHLVELVGAESIIFASDYPHWDFDNPETFDTHLRRYFDESILEQVLCKTPASIFNVSD